MGRPGIMGAISELVVRKALENAGCGYTRIQGAIANLGQNVGRGTVANVLNRNGIEPAPERNKRTRWSKFLKAHWKMFATSDFLSVEVWTGRGLVTYYLLFVISLADRVVHIAGITTRSDEAWMLQAGRDLTYSDSGALYGKRYLILDRDTKYTEQFRTLVRDSGTNVIRLPPRSPNLNAYAERFVRSIKEECLNRMILVGQASLRRTVSECMFHYHAEGNHQSLENSLIRGMPSVAANEGAIRCRKRGGDTSPPTARRIAQLLLSTSGLRDIIGICGHYGQGAHGRSIMQRQAREPVKIKNRMYYPGATPLITSLVHFQSWELKSAEFSGVFGRSQPAARDHRSTSR